MSLSICFALTVIACSPSRDPLTPSQSFPTRAALDSLLTQPVPTAPVANRVSVERWSLGETTSDVVAEDQKPWVDIVTRFVALAPNNRAAPAASRCLAEQIGRFRMQHRDAPAHRLERLMAMHCGSVSENIATWGQTVAVPGDSTPAALAARWDKQVTDILAKATQQSSPQTQAEFSGARASIGIWAQQQEGKLLLSLAITFDMVDFEPISIRDAPSAGEPRWATVRGRIRGPAATIRAQVNWQTHETRACTFDAKVALPNFSMQCPLDDGEPWLTLTVGRAGRLLGYHLGHMMLRSQPSAEAPAPPLEITTAAGAPASSTAEFRTRAVALINAQRAVMGVPPLVLELAQSETNQRFVPHFFGSTNTATTDTIALGMMAGYDVQGMIHDAWFQSTGLAPKTSPEVWVAMQLETPEGRYALLRPTYDRIALGVTDAGTLTTVYGLFQRDSDQKALQRLSRRLVELRRARGRAVPEFLENDDLVAEARLVAQKGKHPMAALEDATARIQARVGGSKQYGFTMGNDLDTLPFPDQMLDANGLRLRMTVTHTKLPGAAWGQFIVLYVFTAYTPQTAHAPAGGRLRSARGSRERGPFLALRTP